MAKSRFDSRNQSIPTDRFGGKAATGYALDEMKARSDEHWGAAMPQGKDDWSKWMHGDWDASQDERRMNDERDRQFLRDWLAKRADSFNKRDGYYEDVQLPSGRVVRINMQGGMMTATMRDEQQAARRQRSDHQADSYRYGFAEASARDDRAARDAFPFYLRLIERLGGSVMVPRHDLQFKVSDFDITTANDYARDAQLIAVKRRAMNERGHHHKPPGVAQLLFGFADQLDARATDAAPHEAGVYADIAAEMRQNIRAAFHDILTEGMLDREEQANRVRVPGANKLPDQFWQEIPRKYVAAACDKKTNAWYAYTTTDLEWSGSSGTWVPTAQAREKDERVVSDIEHIGDDVSIPCLNHRESLTIRPGHKATTQE